MILDNTIILDENVIFYHKKFVIRSLDNVNFNKGKEDIFKVGDNVTLMAYDSYTNLKKNIIDEAPYLIVTKEGKFDYFNFNNLKYSLMSVNDFFCFCGDHLRDPKIRELVAAESGLDEGSS